MTYRLLFDGELAGRADRSGIGRQQGIEGMEDFTQPRIVNAALVRAGFTGERI